MATEEGASMATLVRMLMEDRERREQQVAVEKQRMLEERQRREDQAALERAQMREQMEILQRLVERTMNQEQERERVPVGGLVDRTMNQEQERERVPVAAVERSKDSVMLSKFTETEHASLAVDDRRRRNEE